MSRGLAGGRDRRECVDQVTSARPAVLRGAGECLCDDLVQFRRYVRAERTDPRRVFGEPFRDENFPARPNERRLADEHLVEDTAQAVDVGPGVELGRPDRLLRTHVRGSTEGDAAVGDCLPHLTAGGVDRAGDAEVRYDGVAVHEQDVTGLDVAVYDAAPVRQVERPRDLASYSCSFIYGKAMLLAQTIAERRTFHERHDVVERPLDFSGVVDRQDVGVLQPRDDADLAQKALGAEENAELGAENFDGYGAVVANVVGEVDVRHPSPTDLPLNDIAVSDRVLKAVEKIGGHNAAVICRSGTAYTNYGARAPTPAKGHVRDCLSSCYAGKTVIRSGDVRPEGGRASAPRWRYHLQTSDATA